MNVVITGASRGIGLELTRQALQAGHQVLAVARHPEKSEGLNALKKDFKTLNTLAVELTDDAAPQKIIQAVGSWNEVDVLINNAGIYKKGTGAADFIESFRVNSVTPYLVTEALLPKLQKSQKPVAAQITSLMGSIADNGSGGSVVYRSSKTALNMINKCIALENPWLTTLVLHPGWVKTDMGGEQAPVETEQSAGGLWKVIQQAKNASSGRFYDFRGKELPW